jgi:hypothetical protein
MPWIVDVEAERVLNWISVAAALLTTVLIMVLV